MKFKLIILLALMGLAGARDFVVYPAGSVSFSGCNCRGDDYPNPVELSVSVVNPSPIPLTLSYEWYDPNIDAYRQGDWLKCVGDTSVVFANSLSSCRLRVYTAMGGLNGSSPINIIVIGTNGVLKYTASFDVEVSYHTSPFEINVLSRIQSAEQDFEQLRESMDGSCYGKSCCGMLASNDYLNLALDNLSAANASLRECQLSSSWNYTMNAFNLISAAKESLTPVHNNCSVAVSLINETGLRIASVAKVIAEDKKCGSDVALAEARLGNANSSLEEAAEALASDDYAITFSKLREANSSISNSVSSIGKCPSSTSQQIPVVLPVKQNSTNSSLNQTSPEVSNTLLIVGGAFMALLILVAAVAVALPFLKRQPHAEEAPRTPPEVHPTAPPAQPPAAPPIAPVGQEDLEKEFNEWLESHQKK